MRIGRLAVGLLLLVVVAACKDRTLPPNASALVIIDTNVDVPRTISRVRIDVFSSDGHWLEARDYPVLRADQWPLTFGVVQPDDASARVLLRVRGYVEGATRDYRGVRATDAPPVVVPAKPLAATLGELCRAAPQLQPFEELTLRMGADALAEDSCPEIVSSGTVAANVHVVAAGKYRFGIVRTDPPLGSPFIDPSIFVRRSCEDAATEIACMRPLGNSTTGAMLTLDLQPGDYTVMAADFRDELREDITLRWAPDARWDEVHLTPPTIEAPPPPPKALRLVTADGDETPESEPDPYGTIDRLVAFQVDTDTKVEERVLLDGACRGMATQLVLRADGTVSAEDSATCTGGKLAPPASAVGPAAPATISSRSTFPATTCAGNAADDHIVCIPAGTFVIGSEPLDEGSLNNIRLRSLPLRTLAMDAFYMDRFELTVGRYREATGLGFSPTLDDPIENDTDTLAPSTNLAPFRDHTWSSDRRGREAYPLNGVRWQTARDLCQFYGGDLPTEAQWEYAALAAGRDRKSIYPWGDEKPTCTRAVAAHFPNTGQECPSSTILAPVDGMANAFDVTPLGVVGMGGSLTEYTRSSYVPYDDPCWAMPNPTCLDDSSPYRSVRGGSWGYFFYLLQVAQRGIESTPTALATMGVRCVYEKPPKRTWKGP